jgi:hypothetical protein
MCGVCSDQNADAEYGYCIPANYLLILDGQFMAFMIYKTQIFKSLRIISLEKCDFVEE